MACITGAASGIGYAIATAFAQKGADLFLIDRSASMQEKAAELAGQYQVKSCGITQDLSEKGCAQKLADKCIEVFGGVDVLVNNVGVSFLDHAENLTEEHWDKTLDINLKVPFLMSQSFGGYMIKNKAGNIINIASQGGMVALEKHIAYCASKAAVISMTQVCALEWGKYNINVNCISPTVILTDMGKNYWQGEIAENMLTQIPIGRFGYPDEVAAACVYLASDAAGLMSGANLVLDGGYTIK